MTPSRIASSAVATSSGGAAGVQPAGHRLGRGDRHRRAAPNTPADRLGLGRSSSGTPAASAKTTSTSAGVDARVGQGQLGRPGARPGGAAAARRAGRRWRRSRRSRRRPGRRRAPGGAPRPRAIEHRAALAGHVAAGVGGRTAGRPRPGRRRCSAGRWPAGRPSPTGDSERVDAAGDHQPRPRCGSAGGPGAMASRPPACSLTSTPHGPAHAVPDGDLAGVDRVEPGEGLVRADVLRPLAPQASAARAGRTRSRRTELAVTTPCSYSGSVGRVDARRRPAPSSAAASAEPGHPVGLRHQPARHVVGGVEAGDLAGQPRPGSRSASKRVIGPMPLRAAPGCRPVVARCPTPVGRDHAEPGDHDARALIAGSSSGLAEHHRALEAAEPAADASAPRRRGCSRAVSGT